MSEDDAALGRRLRMIRKYLGYTQDDAARAIGESRPTYSMVELGKRRLTALELLRLARLYSLPPAFLLEAPDASQPAGIDPLSLAGLAEEDRAELLRFAEYLRHRKAERDRQHRRRSS